MGTGSSTDNSKKEEDAVEINEESGGLHLIELHLPTAGGAVAVVLIAILAIVGLRWYMRHRKRNSIRRHADRRHLEELELGAIQKAPIPAPSAPPPPPPPPPPSPVAPISVQPLYPPIPLARAIMNWHDGSHQPYYHHQARMPQRFDNERFEPAGDHDYQPVPPQGPPQGYARDHFRRARDEQPEQQQQ